MPITDRPGDSAPDARLPGYEQHERHDRDGRRIAVAALRRLRVRRRRQSRSTRTAAYRISGSGITETTINLTDPASTNFTGTFIQAAGPPAITCKFTITAGGFTLTATPVSGTNPTLRAPINAIQIVPDDFSHGSGKADRILSHGLHGLHGSDHSHGSHGSHGSDTRATDRTNDTDMNSDRPAAKTLNDSGCLVSVFAGRASRGGR